MVTVRAITKHSNGRDWEIGQMTLNGSEEKIKHILDRLHSITKEEIEEERRMIGLHRRF